MEIATEVLLLRFTTGWEEVTVGTILRLMKTSKIIYLIVRDDLFLWKYIGRKCLGLERFTPTYHGIVDSIQRANRCLECGGKNGRKSVMTNFRITLVCSNCQNDVGGFRHMLTRKEIQNKVNTMNVDENGWKRKKRNCTSVNKIVKNSIVARRTVPGCKHLYWSCDVHLQNSMHT